MKVLKVILLLFLVLKASLGFNMSMDMGCCGDSVQTECPADIPSEEDRGCCGDICDCLCCGHIFTFNKSLDMELGLSTYNHQVLIPYTDNFTSRFTSSLWQPPRRY